MLRCMIAFFASMFLLVSVGCSKGPSQGEPPDKATILGDNTYMRFTIEGKDYEINGVNFQCIDTKHENYKNIFIGQDKGKISYNNAPDGTLNWVMQLNDVPELQGKEIDFSAIASEAKAKQCMEPGADFILYFASYDDEKTVGRSMNGTSNMTVKIDKADDNFVKGTFVGTDYCYLSVPDKISKEGVGVTGSFRAKVKYAK